MGRRGKKLFESYKRRGEWAELLFMTVASGLGFNVAKPWGESPRYDVIVEQEARFLRVQVKSTEMWLGTCYLCQLYAFGQAPYTAKEIDYYAIYVMPADVWYIFPVKTLTGKRTIAVTPHLKGHKYERYMENWWLLTRHHSRRGARTVLPPEAPPGLPREAPPGVPQNDPQSSSAERLRERILKRIANRNR